MPANIMMLKNVLIGSFAFILVACTSIHNDPIVENEIKDVVQTDAASYSCADKPLTIYFHAEQAQIEWEGENYQLNHAMNAFGVSYLGDGISFWIDGNKAELKMNGTKDIPCDLVRIDS